MLHLFRLLIRYLHNVQTSNFDMKWQMICVLCVISLSLLCSYQQYKHIQHSYLCLHWISSSLHHHNCILHCLFHRCKSRLQPNDDCQLHNSPADGTCIQCSTLSLYQGNSSLRHHNCILHCWLHHDRTRLQPTRETDNLQFDQKTV